MVTSARSIYTHPVKKLIPFLLCGCFQLPQDLADPITEVMPFDNPFVTVDDAVVQRFDLTLKCPDGEPASFHLVYRAGSKDPAPAVILLHSGAFDYVVQPGEDGPLSGIHYHAESRLSQEFALRKVWETLGLQINDLDPAENNLGTLPAALVNRGVVQFLPGNCWGDMWHNEEGVVVNDLALDGFNRNGRTIANWMLRLLSESDFAKTQDIDWPTAIDASQIFLIGLGDGGRGVRELLLRPGPRIAGAAVDSVPDNLSAFVEHPVDFEDEIDGFARIYGDLSDIDEQSFARDTPLPDRFYYLWSNYNPQMPISASRPAANALQGQLGVVVKNTSASDHVLSNSDFDVAKELVDFLLGPVDSDGTVSPDDTGR